MEIFGMVEEGNIKRHQDSMEKLRQTVMNYFNQCVTKYKKQLSAQFRSRYTSWNLIVNNEDEGGNKQLIDVAPGDKVIEDNEDKSNKLIDVVSPSTLATYNCEIAIFKKNKQAVQAAKEIKKCGRAAIESGAAPGAVVTLKVDYRTHPYAQGLLAILYDVKQTGGILVGCDHGVITHSGNKKDYWVPVDKYRVVARKDEGCPLPAELTFVRDMVLTGEFDLNPCPRILYAKLHAKRISATSPIKIGKGCKCKNGICGKACGCKKKKLKCHSRCSCNGNCCIRK
jgi:hypothetical protein